MKRCLLVVVLLAATPLIGTGVRAQAPAEDPSVQAFVTRVEQALQGGKAEAFLQLLATGADRSRARVFAEQELRGDTTRAILMERERLGVLSAAAAAYRLILDAFVEVGDRARVATWQIDIARGEAGWAITDLTRVSAIESLYRLSITPTKQFTARDFSVKAEDMELTLSEGSVFTVETDQGVTGLVLLGRGDLRFEPTPMTERGQVRIFSGHETLESRFDAAYVRLGAVSLHADLERLEPRAVDPRDLRRAQEIFREESVKSFSVDLGDLSRDVWSLLPNAGDILAEVRTRRFDTLTYSRSRSEPEDISLFDRRRQKNIAVYASAGKLLAQGPFYNEDDFAAYDVLEYDLDVSLAPERSWLEGRATLRLRTRAPVLGQLTLRIAEPLTVHSVTSEEFGRLFSLRVRNQNNVLVNLPVSVLEDTDLTITVIYSGRLTPQPPDRETLLQQRMSEPQWVDELAFPRAEPSYLYSNRSYWYPQSPISDYATAKIRISLPPPFGCVASGEPVESPPPGGADTAQARRVFRFEARRPVRYLAFLVSRFTRADGSSLTFDGVLPAASTPGDATSLTLTVDAQPRQVQRGRELAGRAAEIARFYQSIVGDAPYEGFTLAVIESTLPGGHSPAYFAALHQPLPNVPLVWRTDPASFEGFPDFFLAHELAHQWWGQAVGWRNYHEQWLSEGFAQYFAALYAERSRGPGVFGDMLRHMRKWSLDESDQGPVYLGYRLGHIKGDDRVFRALVYNKGAAVLHMLRRFIGDDAFFAGLRLFYAGARFRKVGTEDLRVAMESASNRSLERFFERWIYGASLPRLTFSYRVEAAPGRQDAVLRFEQAGDVFDLPVTAILHYADRKPASVRIPVTEQRVDIRVPVEGSLRSIEISEDDGTLVEVDR